ncbi:MAG: 2-keto-4-pentenoate hydratase [Pseudomonadota bacterium]
MPKETDPAAAAARALSPALDEISQRLVAARLRAAPLRAFPGELPTTLKEAYAVQSASIARWPDEVAGWKVGGVPLELRATLGADRLSGPIYRATVHHIGAGSEQSMAIYQGGFAAVEAEFVFRLNRRIEPDGAYHSDQELIDCVTLHVGAEIASSPMADINRIGPVCVVCDFGNNGGLLVGPPVPDWRTRAGEDLRAEVLVDGISVGQATAADLEGGLLRPLRFLIELCADRGLTLPEGTFVSCGALTGIHEVTVDSRASVDFGAFGAFRVAFEAKRPMPDSASSKKH